MLEDTLGLEGPTFAGRMIFFLVAGNSQGSRSLANPKGTLSCHPKRSRLDEVIRGLGDLSLMQLGFRAGIFRADLVVNDDGVPLSLLRVDY